ncbi:MAG: diaminopimelate epimerase [Clostridium sp.]|nr:diaminopimelate epimerase [Clostridium sp.]MCM1444218.1 diaminopimelate epimerase [Candidatus Amulumruptor caecigallinarius]
MLDFIKMEGCGNNYIYIDYLDKDLGNYDYSLLSREISNINYGIGSDGLILICKSNVADAKMIMYNKDGSEGSMCGNGIRCVAKYLYQNILKKNKMTIETKSGIKKVMVNEKDNSITVDMGKPILTPNLIPVTLEGENVIDKKFKFNDIEIRVTCVSMGNPHTVIFVNDVNNINIEYLGKIIQKSNIFPNQCNVEFVQIIDSNNIKIRVYERGSGETFSCGTGACASVVAGVLNGYLNFNEEINVELIGGNLKVIYKDTVLLNGDANTICKGKYFVKNKN